jgi:hypothetical protein
MYRCYYEFAKKTTLQPAPIRKRPGVKLYATEIQDRLLPLMRRGFFIIVCAPASGNDTCGTRHEGLILR